MIYAIISIIYAAIGIFCAFIYMNEYQNYDYDNTPVNLYVTIFIGMIFLWPIAIIEYLITDYWDLF